MNCEECGKDSFVTYRNVVQGKRFVCGPCIREKYPEAQVGRPGESAQFDYKQPLRKGEPYRKDKERAFYLLNQADVDGFARGFHLLSEAMRKLIDSVPREALEALAEAMDD